MTHYQPTPQEQAQRKKDALAERVEKLSRVRSYVALPILLRARMHVRVAIALRHNSTAAILVEPSCYRGLTCPSFCTSSNERVYITALGCEICFGSTELQAAGTGGL
jgi:hypothetical protein